MPPHMGLGYGGAELLKVEMPIKTKTQELPKQERPVEYLFREHVRINKRRMEVILELQELRDHKWGNFEDLDQRYMDMGVTPDARQATLEVELTTSLPYRENLLMNQFIQVGFEPWLDEAATIHYFRKLPVDIKDLPLKELEHLYNSSEFAVQEMEIKMKSLEMRLKDLQNQLNEPAQQVFEDEGPGLKTNDLAAPQLSKERQATLLRMIGEYAQHRDRLASLREERVKDLGKLRSALHKSPLAS